MKVAEHTNTGVKMQIITRPDFDTLESKGLSGMHRQIVCDCARPEDVVITNCLVMSQGDLLLYTHDHYA